LETVPEPRAHPKTGDTGEALHRLHGLKLSYFTGKLEAYFRVKGVAFEFVGMDTADFRRCARETGIAQMPQVQAPDGRWLTDTTAIIAEFETGFAGPALSPRDPLTRFFSLLLEDLFDEWLWRPALYYRWAFAEDRILMSSQIARTMLRDVPLPFSVRRRLILARQRRQYLRQDGITRQTAPAIEALYRDTLQMLEAIFRVRPFLMGARPVEADFGLMGPFLRHFSHDPTPAAILRETAPYTQAWVARVWAMTPDDAEAASLPERVPDDLQGLITMAARDYLPYLEANALAVIQSAPTVKYAQGGADWSVPAAPYRAACLDALKAAYLALPDEARAAAHHKLGSGAVAILSAPKTAFVPRAGRPLGRLWENARTA
jgi:glutathione S-transferase